MAPCHLGEFVREQDVSVKLGVSRTPVGEALEQNMDLTRQRLSE